MKLVCVSFLILILVYISFGTFQYRKVLNESIQVIKEDIALDLATVQILSAKKKVETLKKFGFKDLKIVLETENSSDNNFMATQVPLVVDGALVGYLNDSPTITTLIEFVLGSTYLGVFFILLFIFISFMIIVPLASYKRKVQKLIKSAMDRPLVQSDSQQIDDVTAQIIKIINMNTNYALQIHQLNYEIKEKEAVAALAKQVAHDIRSPLSVLNMIIPTLNSDWSKEKCEFLLHATQRIDKIAEDLLSKGRVENKTFQITSSDLEKIALEKQMILASQSRNIRIDTRIPKNKIFNSRISKIDFERIVSNLLNNAIEAFSKDQFGVVDLGLTEVDNSIVFVIQDNGKGIPENVLSQIGNKGFSLGKSNGNGLGVHHAKSTIEQAGGKFIITSQVGIGTTITITI